MRSLHHLFIMIISVGIILTACRPVRMTQSDEPPGVGAKAELGYATCSVIIVALEQYHADQGSYPETLKELGPQYLEKVPTQVNNEDIEYSKTEESYTLSFHYFGPGMNSCTYTPEEKWHCTGAL